MSSFECQTGPCAPGYFCSSARVSRPGPRGTTLVRQSLLALRKQQTPQFEFALNLGFYPLSRCEDAGCHLAAGVDTSSPDQSEASSEAYSTRHGRMFETTRGIAGCYTAVYGTMLCCTASNCPLLASFDPLLVPQKFVFTPSGDEPRVCRSRIYCIPAVYQRGQLASN